MQDGSAFDQQSGENAVTYELHLHAGATPDELDQLRVHCMTTVLPYLTGYIWQQDPFTLQSSTTTKSPWSNASLRTAHTKDADAEASAYLWGVTRFGDNIEDEWLIVWLLYQITIKFSNISARIWDNDGDFLLIEAAYSLPRWLKPETSTNRVWLNAGRLHVIPLPNKGFPSLPAAPTVQQALQIIFSDAISTTANVGMQEAITAKTKGYPQKTRAEIHRARCLLPAKIAHVLQQKPQLVSAAVQTFHYRDMQDMRAAAKLASFPPQDLVTVIVPFNRALYAQLAQQQFQPPRGYPLPSPTSPGFKAADLGMKLTCGFEMVLAKYTSGSASVLDPRKGSQACQLDTAALTNSPRWAAYEASLAKNGYFKGNIPGSAQYKELLAEAMKAFTQSETYQQSADAAAAPAEAIAAILQQPVDVKQFKGGPEDDDSWMTGGAGDLEVELAQRQKEMEGDVAKRAKRTAQGLGSPKAAPEFDPSEMVSKLNAFINQSSSHEGAEVPNDMGPDVTFNDPVFWKELKSVLGVSAGEHNVDLDHTVDSGSTSSSGGFSEDEDESSSSDSSISDSEGHRPHRHSQQPAARFGHGIQPSSQSSAPVKGSSDQQHHPSTSPTGGHDSAYVNRDDSGSESGVMTATDSDDDEAGFMHAYDQALADELAESRVGSIINAEASAARASTSEDPNVPAGLEQGAANELKPVDLDTNLVRNLLQSYTAQQGLAGPAGNLVGLLGLNMPDHTEAD